MMSRSGYVEYYDHNDWTAICWRGAVKSAIRGRRGQAFIREMLESMDALPEKKLIAGELQSEDGSFCAIGTVGHARGIDMSNLNPYDTESVAGTFGIADALAREILYTNDEAWSRAETPEQRFIRVRLWLQSCLRD